MSKKREGRFVCKCECGGQVRGIEDFGQLWTWCEKCSPVETVKVRDVSQLFTYWSEATT